MAKTADVIQSIWGDPWFLRMSVDGKCLYLWAITNEHGNLAGLYTVAAPMIQLETGLTPARFKAALEDCGDKLFYREETGAVWVKGRAKRVRSKTSQIAKSIIKAVEECPEDDFKAAFVQKYGSERWLSNAFEDSALQAFFGEPHPNLSEVHSQSHSLSLSPLGGLGESEPASPSPVEVVFEAWVESTGKTAQTQLDKDRRKFITAALRDYPVEDVVDAVRGWKFSAHHRGENENKTVYNGLHLLLKNAEKIEQFRDLARRNTRQPSRQVEMP